MKTIVNPETIVGVTFNESVEIVLHSGVELDLGNCTFNAARKTGLPLRDRLGAVWAALCGRAYCSVNGPLILVKRAPAPYITITDNVLHGANPGIEIEG